MDCDPSARKKLKVLVDRVDEPEDKTSEETENAASVPQLKKTNELKLSPERSSQFDIYSGQVSNTYEKQVAGKIGEYLQRITCHEIYMQRLE